MNLSKKSAEVEQRKNISVGMTQKEKGIVSFFSEREASLQIHVKWMFIQLLKADVRFMQIEMECNSV